MGDVKRGNADSAFGNEGAIRAILPKQTGEYAMNEINIDDLTLGQIRNITTLLYFPDSEQNKDPASTTAYRIGEKYLIRTITYHVVGKLVAITESDLVLEQASWVADSGRWNDALKTGNLSEVEPFTSPVIVSRAAIVDGTSWPHQLPIDVK